MLEQRAQSDGAGRSSRDRPGRPRLSRAMPFEGRQGSAADLHEELRPREPLAGVVRGEDPDVYLLDAVGTDSILEKDDVQLRSVDGMSHPQRRPGEPAFGNRG